MTVADILTGRWVIMECKTVLTFHCRFFWSVLERVSGWD